MNKWLIILLILVLAKSLLWIKIVPIFQTPDEQAHFAQLQWYAEKKSLSIDPEKNLSLEVATAEEILGTRRDIQGNNKYTYHPEYKNNSKIPNFPKSYRAIYVDREAAGYPPLYYLLALPFYNAVYDANLTDRIMASRLISLILSLGLATVAYKIGREIWEDKLQAVTLAILVSFQPMISFVSAGLHPDNLLNLLYSLGILILLLIIKNGIKIKYLIFLGGIFFLGLQTKILMIFFLPIATAVIFRRYWLLAFAILSFPALAFLFLLPLPYMPHPRPTSPLWNMGLIQYLQFRVPRLAFEMWPWFWGVFKWLGVTLPPLAMKVITRVAIFAAIGLGVKLFKREKSLEFKFIILCILSLESYVLYLVLWDWRLMQTLGYSQGLQGRYLFPNIIPAMFLLLVGITTWHKKLGQIIALAVIVLNIIALMTVHASY